MKKKISLLLAILMLMTIVPTAFAEEKTVDAVKTSQNITLDGEEIQIGSYLIEGKNYLKLRDVAAVMNRKKSQFSVGYDKENKLVSVELSKPYEKIEGDLEEIKVDSAKALLRDMKISINGEEKTVKSALINSNNYMQLRDLGNLVGFGVGFDKETRTVILKSDGKVEEKNDETVEETEEPKAPIDDSKAKANFTDEQMSEFAILPITDESIKKYGNDAHKLSNCMASFFMFAIVETSSDVEMAIDFLDAIGVKATEEDVAAFVNKMKAQAEKQNLELSKGLTVIHDLKSKPLTVLLQHKEALSSLTYYPEKKAIIGMVMPRPAK